MKSSRTLKKATEVVRSGACFVSLVLGCGSLLAQAAPQAAALSKLLIEFVTKETR